MGAAGSHCCCDTKDDDHVLMPPMPAGTLPLEASLAMDQMPGVFEGNDVATGRSAAWENDVQKDTHAAAAAMLTKALAGKRELSTKPKGAEHPAVTKPEPAGERPQAEMPANKAGPKELEVIIDLRPGASIGLNLDALQDEQAFVDGITAGFIQEWNADKPRDRQLCPYDSIVGINGFRGDTKELLNEMRDTSQWCLIVRRPVELAISVDCDSSPTLGLDLKYSPNGRSLLIASIGEGSIRERNLRHAQQIRPGDRIVEVNGQRGTAKQLLEAASNVDTLELVIVHFE